MRVVELFRYPVKSVQGCAEELLRIGPGGVLDDRRWGVVTADGTRVLSAKRYRHLLDASTDGRSLTLPDGSTWALPEHGDDPALDAALSEWLGVDVRLSSPEHDPSVSFEMTFDPPNDDAEYVTIDAPAGTFLDSAPLHAVTRQTLTWCAAQRDDLDWDVRRFRPNLVLDAPEAGPFDEDGWTGRRLAVGGAVVAVRQPTVRCAMPLRAQPGLERQPELYRALEDLHANHLGVYLDVVEPGEVAVGDDVRLLD